MRALATLTALTTEPWAMLPHTLAQMCGIVLGERDPEQAQLLQELHAQRLAVAVADGRPMDGTENVMIRDGVAIIPVNGPIFRYGNMFTRVSGCASIECLARDFTAALNNPAVGAILFWIDSPGGQVTGTHNFADMVYAARGQKPIETYAEGVCASGAYWIASATSRITCEATCDLGSVGVVMAVPDPNARLARDITFVSSQSPNKRPDPTTESGKSRFQRMVDDPADIFIASVARNRNLTPEQVVADFDEGGVLTGARAVAAKMADRVGTFEQTLADLVAQAQQRRVTIFPRRAAAGTESERFMARLKEGL